jgi:hypothetical protein
VSPIENTTKAALLWSLESQASAYGHTADSFPSLGMKEYLSFRHVVIETLVWHPRFDNDLWHIWIRETLRISAWLPVNPKKPPAMYHAFSGTAGTSLVLRRRPHASV